LPPMYCFTVLSMPNDTALPSRSSKARDRGHPALRLLRYGDLDGGLSRGRQRAQPLRRQIFEHAFAATFAAVTRLAIAAETAGSVELVGTVDPDDARFDLRGEVERDVDVLAPHTGGETVDSVVGELDRFSGVRKVIATKTGPKISSCTTVAAGCTSVSNVGG